ncbi:MAG: hypothetical protein ACM3US_02420 [Sphingomonadaceae bacterium]
MAFQDKAAEVARLRRAYDARVSEIRADKTLSAMGQQQLIRKAFEETNDAIAKLRREYEAEREQERRELQRRAFGVPHFNPATPAERAQVAEGYRAAIDRAERAKDPAQALTLLQRSDWTGDTHLGRAVALVAAEKGWHGVLTEAVNLGMADHDAVSELQAHIMGDSSPARFNRRVALSGPMRPPELDRPLPPEAA